MCVYLKQIILSLVLDHRDKEYCHFLCREYINPYIIARPIVRVKKSMDQIKTLK